jgi:hypothetical protein
MPATAIRSRTWDIISDINGRDKRTVTLAQYLAEVAAAKARAKAATLSVDAKFAALRAALG